MPNCFDVSWKEKKKTKTVTAWIGPATLTFSNGWLENVWRGFCLILAGSTREIESKEKHSEYFIYHQQAGPYLNAAFWPYCHQLQSKTRTSAYPACGYHLASSAAISTWIQFRNPEWQHGVGPLHNKEPSGFAFEESHISIRTHLSLW